MKKRIRKECSLKEYSSFLKKDNVIVDTFCLFFFVFSLKILTNLRTSKEQLSLDFGKKLRTIQPPFEKHGSHKNKRVYSTYTLIKTVQFIRTHIDTNISIWFCKAYFFACNHLRQSFHLETDVTSGIIAPKWFHD